ncbi:hypothetical protein BACINT_01452 [Bacteroides intestinalis DSM 17393]|uniref:Uncharacterized protein n=1 Tax=Bacteroides intestinalis DSM 17393 TaxID=471870 RepID=B3CAD8_9BACE|nr:hypothetical protein BACINT_01452 [Bacteroides intestinalis DSM 17393]
MQSAEYRVPVHRICITGVYYAIFRIYIQTQEALTVCLVFPDKMRCKVKACFPLFL